MPYKGGSLVSLFDKGPQRQTQLAAFRMAKRGGDRMVDLTVLNTPIDSGNLRTSWYQLPVKKVRHLLAPRDGGYQSGVATDVDYAPHVEYGTGLWGPNAAKYPIVPKNAPMLAWRDRETGDWHYAMKVMHPGSPGQHMVAIAADVTEFEADSGTLFRGILDDWARRVEAHAD